MEHMNNTQKRIKSAKDFAIERHGAIDHRRKYTGEPYHTHLDAVAKIVESVGGTTEMIMATWLHDTVEDTNTTIEEIYDLFGKMVGDYVKGLTDVATKEDGNRNARNAINRKHNGDQPNSVKTIKLADSIHNVSDIMRNDPKFGVTYIEEKKALLPYLKGGNIKLFNKLHGMLYD